MEQPCGTLPGRVKILYETSGREGGWDRAVREAKAIARRRQTTVYVDFRHPTRTWVVWDWAHHDTPRLAPMSEIRDSHGRFMMTAVGPGEPPRAHADLRRGRRATTSEKSIVGRNLRAEGWSVGRGGHVSWAEVTAAIERHGGIPGAIAYLDHRLVARYGRR